MPDNSAHSLPETKSAASDDITSSAGSSTGTAATFKGTHSLYERHLHGSFFGYDDYPGTESSSVSAINPMKPSSPLCHMSQVERTTMLKKASGAIVNACSRSCYGDGLSVPPPSPSDIASFLVLAIRGSLGNATTARMACASRSALASPRDGLASWLEVVVAGATRYSRTSFHLVDPKPRSKVSLAIMNPDAPLALGAYVDVLQAEITTLRARNRELELEVLELKAPFRN
ncbi:hypothetical protein HD553DRAFT_326358 [Filobasidium floriforme]|uniref:uncharacterized protein n=1 Tax=Filobasidium floriforme TaxID=5210 RepID=UPI001E8ECD53|nr:uncharacterized protein HD553DRAFT_326358 [Filobasidium floriforme]KAH8079629.1 hypothetical protein HD553DRAFT_326358 [Filobasidium floriforme]